jgi:acyl-coenzyme A synthetase/AMP-(fatty) acid ligase
MRTPHSNFPSLRDEIEVDGTPPPGDLIGAEYRVHLSDLVQMSAIQPGVEELGGRLVLIASSDPLLVALTLIELDGLARRLVLYPPDLDLDHLPYVMQCAEVDAVVSDGSFLRGASIGAAQQFLCKPALTPRAGANRERVPTEWILLTSGTTGRPKMVQHTLASLAGAIGVNEWPGGVIWCTFYDIRRYGGLQIFLRAVLRRSSLVLTRPQETVANFLQRAGKAGATHFSGTPSHWRRALMSPEANRIAPQYIRLSGEIADQAILDNLRSFYPNAVIGHAFATTEAGVVLEVRDELSGFPADMLTDTLGVDLKVADATLRVRSNRTAARYLGENPPALKDPEGFVDTGDVLELRAGRYYFQGRRDGMINIGGLKVYPEEVEAALNRHPQVRLSRVKAQKSSITGALVVADVVLKDQAIPEDEQALELQQALIQYCRESLAPHKAPAAIRFVSALAITEPGKLMRHHG